MSRKWTGTPFWWWNDRLPEKRPCSVCFRPHGPGKAQKRPCVVPKPPALDFFRSQSLPTPGRTFFKQTPYPLLIPAGQAARVQPVVHGQRHGVARVRPGQKARMPFHKRDQLLMGKIKNRVSSLVPDFKKGPPQGFSLLPGGHRLDQNEAPLLF